MECKCEHCGKTFTGKNVSHTYRFCSPSCAAHGRDYGNYDKTLDWKKDGGQWQCPYNEGVHCRSRVCHRCGWNPEVIQKRNDVIKEAMA